MCVFWCLRGEFVGDKNKICRLNMMTSSNGSIFSVAGPLWGESTGDRWIPRTNASEAELWCFFDLCLNKRLSNQSKHRWFETPSRLLWRHWNQFAMLSFVSDTGMRGYTCSVSILLHVSFISSYVPYITLYISIHIVTSKLTNHIAVRNFYEIEIIVIMDIEYFMNAYTRWHICILSHC